MMLAEILFGLNTLAFVPLTGEVTDLSPKLIWVDDLKGDMTLETFSEAVAQGRYKTAHGDTPNLGYVQHPVFFAVALENHTPQKHFVLNISYPLLDEVTFYRITASGISEPLTSGDHVPFSQRFRPYRTINFKLALDTDAHAYAVFRIHSDSPIQLQLKAHTEADFGDYAAQESMILGLYYGLNLVMILYNAFLYLSLRNRSYLYYVGYLSFYVLFQAGLHGVIFQIFFPNYPGLNDKLLWIAGSVGWIFAYLFSLQFHDLKKRLPALARAVLLMTRIHVVFLVISFVLPYYLVAWIGTFLVSVVNSLMMVSIGFISLSRGYRPARYFAMGWSVLVFGNFIYGLKSFGILPSYVLIDNAMLIGSSIEVVLLSLALGDRVNLIQQERDEANRAVIDGYSRLQVEIDRREELEKQKAVLGEEIRQATEQLIQADKMSTMGQLVAGVAHDIANPTQLIINSKLDALKTVGAIEERLHALLEGDDPEVLAVKKSFAGDIDQTKASLHDISTAVGRIEDVQSAIRNQTRVDSKPSMVQLRPLIDECFTILRSKLKRLRMEVECSENLSLECRRSQLGQVITNLISNAADALAEKNLDAAGPHLLIRVSATENHVTIEVEDDGPGIPADTAEKIFRPFYTTKAVGVGTGLGLSICQKIISAHGGTIQLRQAQRLHGACFCIEMPIRR